MARIAESSAKVASCIRQEIFDERHQLNISSERVFHDSIAKIIESIDLVAKREWRVSPRDRFDFWLPESNSVIEIKLRPRMEALVRQLLRYAEYPEVEALILISVTVPPGLPGDLSKKPLFVIPCWTYVI